MAGDIRSRIADYQPTKTVWLWSTVAAIGVTLIVGFTWGGWTTAGAAADRAEKAADDAVVAFAAEICAHRFLHAPDAAAQLAALKEESRFSRGNMIEDGGWVTFAEAEDPLRGAARACADRLMEAELPEVPATAEATAEAITAS